LAAFILLGPAYRQVFRGKEEFMPKWTMFSGMALNFFEISLKYRGTDTEAWQSVPPHLVGEVGRLREEKAPLVPLMAIRLRTSRDVDVTLRNVCRELGQNGQLLMDLRKADRTAGWKDISRRKVHPCDGSSHRGRTRRNGAIQ
jgi:hypothetical protein